jgi:hypothetical protein
MRAKVSDSTARQASPMVVSIVRIQSCGRFWWSERISRLYAALTRDTWRVCASLVRI